MKDWLHTRIEIPKWMRIELPSWRSLKPPFSFSSSVAMAIVIGLFSPMALRKIDYKRFCFVSGYDYQAYPWLFLLSLTVIVALIYRVADRKRFRWDTAATVQLLLAIVLFASGITTSALNCAKNHLCLCGHMEHPPYPSYDYVSDAAWVGGVILSIFILARVRSPATIAFAVLGGFVLSLRFVFGDFGGAYPPPL